MKKTIILSMLGCIALMALSCTKTCTCQDNNGKIKQLEVKPSDKCSDRSSSEHGTCS